MKHESATFFITKCLLPKKPIINADATQVIVSAFAFAVRNERIYLRAFVVMPDHWHALFALRELWILPKFMLEGLAARKPRVVPESGATRVPAREIVVALKCCLLLFPIGVEITTDMLPLAPPADSGVVVTARGTLCLGATVVGKFGPL